MAVSCSDMSGYASRHTAQRSTEDADQAEEAAIKSDSAVFQEGIYDELIAGATDDFDPGEALPDDRAAWERNDLMMDDAAGSVLELIEQRRTLMGDAYPFELRGNSLVHQPSENGVYEFCLAVSRAASLTTGDAITLPRLFEQLSRILVESYLGGFASSHHTGWPRQNGAPNKFKEVVAPLHEQTSEWVWCPEPDSGLPEDPSSSIVKDGGVDFVAWKKTPDNRIGHLFLLGQCACGQNWSSKLGDININKLEKWFHPMTIIPPVSVFCTPFHITDSCLRETSREAGLVFDRIRLSLLAHQADEPILAQLHSLKLSDHTLAE